MIAAFIVAFICSCGTAWYFKRRSERAQKAKIALKKFYISANAVLEDDRTPDEVLDMLDILSLIVRNKNIARKYFFFLISGKAQGAFRKKESSAKDLTKAIAAMPEEIRHHFVVALVSAMFAINYNSVFFGPFLNRFMLFDTNKDAPHEEPRVVEHLVVAYSAKINGMCTPA